MSRIEPVTAGAGPSPAAGSAGRLQPGIYLTSQDQPGRCYRLVLLNVRNGTAPDKAAAAIELVWKTLQDLRRGIVQDLKASRPTDPVLEPDRSEKLTCLLGLGASLFEKYPAMKRPPHLLRLRPEPFPSLRWVPDGERRPGEADLAMQLIAETDLAVDRALVEMWMLVDAGLPLEIVTFHGGFNRRDDRRSWLGFFDGLSNIASQERAAVVTAVGGHPPWMDGGTYMGVLRLDLDLRKWRGLSREHQETIIGRDKLSGCPLERIDPPLNPVAAEGCPVLGHGRAPEKFVDPAPASVRQPLLRQSHIHRANPNSSEPGRREYNRIFRQGYEFVETLGDGRLRLGVNFVSFQGDLSSLTNILMTPGWLGDVNFGGPAHARPGALEPVQGLVRVIAGGYYAVPPDATPFPGADAF
jgi:Dyp-type peroxidase family